MESDSFSNLMEFDEGSSEAYVVMTVEDVISRIEDKINTISSALHVSRGEARILLTKFNWNLVELTDAWFHDQELVQRTVGLLPEFESIGDDQYSEGVNNKFCSMCSRNYLINVMKSVGCGHLFCKSCYKNHIESKIVDGDGVMIKCIEPHCGAFVLDDMIESFVSDEYKEKFDYYVLRSYIKGKKNIKWCPAPGCDYAIEFLLGGGHYGVKCGCSYVFCWNCVDKKNESVDCKAVVSWLSKNKDISPDYESIFANTKPCPKCKKPIDKDKGCIRMTCPKPCGHNFCWLCLGDWGEHHGGFHKCDEHEHKKKNVWVDGDAKKHKTGKFSKRHYFERWALNQCSREKFQENLEDWEVKKPNVIEQLGMTENELRFITEAWLQMIKCGRILKWTFTYTFYMNEESKGNKALFEYLQDLAKESLEKLQDCLERDLNDYLNGGGVNHNIKVKVIDLTKATSGFFGNLVTALENGLEEVKDSSGCCKQSEKYHADEGSSSSKDYVDDGWDCDHCTYHNLNPAAEDCNECLLPREIVQQDFWDD